jgi:hypothetical protein
MTVSFFRRLALTLSLSLAALGAGALTGCAGGGDEGPAPDDTEATTTTATQEACDDTEALKALDITREECLQAPVVQVDPNSNQAVECSPGTVLVKEVIQKSPRLVFVCRCTQSGDVRCFVRD